MTESQPGERHKTTIEHPVKGAVEIELFRATDGEDYLNMRDAELLSLQPHHTFYKLMRELKIEHVDFTGNGRYISRSQAESIRLRAATPQPAKKRQRRNAQSVSGESELPLSESDSPKKSEQINSDPT